MVTVTARIVTNDKSFDASKHAVNFVVTTPDGVKRSFTSVTDANGIAILDVHFPPGPAVASLPLDLTSAGLPIEAAKPAQGISAHPVCELAGVMASGITAIVICAGAVVAAGAAVAAVGPGAPLVAPPMALEAGVVITEASSANGLFVTGTCVAMAKALDALAKPRPVAADGGSSGGAAGGKDSALQGQTGDPNQHQHDDDDRDKNKKIKIFEKNLKHIFRDSPGHLADTPENRKLFIDVASNPENFAGEDRYGNKIFTKILENGKEIWVEVRDEMIRNGGINEAPRHITP
jgi:hypothetical protein